MAGICTAQGCAALGEVRSYIHESFGYTSNEIGFGWTNAAFVLLWQELSEAGKKSLESKCIAH